MSQQINGNDLIALGYPENELIGIALKINRKRNGYNRTEMLEHYAKVWTNAAAYKDDKVFGKLAIAIIDGVGIKIPEDLIELKESAEAYTIYGAENIEEGARKQMNIAMTLPVTVAGALMPDAHQGYGLPIGGVLATNNAIIPYGVGVDIGCRMALSVYDIPFEHFEMNRAFYKEVLMNYTRFGAGNGFLKHERAEHGVMESELFTTNKLIAGLKDKAWTQLGSSGGGNHFVEFGAIHFATDDKVSGISKGTYLALLTHSGSRGFGATIADYYTRLAKELCKLPYHAKNLAYLDLDSEAGNDYWLAMNLAGDYASACHETIHQKIAKALGAGILTNVENHHNFAWKETWNNQEVVVHRKGATPAGKGVMGIIPGSMTAPGFLVRGKGNEASIQSASHGAGRQMSRTQAIKSLTNADLQSVLNDMGVTLIGAGLDEAPMAYKDIRAVIAAQEALVDVVAEFQPKMVRMADDGSRED